MREKGSVPQKHLHLRPRLQKGAQDTHISVCQLKICGSHDLPIKFNNTLERLTELW